MNLSECQQKAIKENAADSAEFDLVNRKGFRSRCKWEDADFGLFKVLDRPAHLVGKLLSVDLFMGDDGVHVENFTVPAKVAPISPALVAAAPDLLAALQRLDAYLDFSTPFNPRDVSTFIDPSGVNEAMRQARAAIAKAEGRS